MNYKKFFPATALVALLSLSNSAFSEPIGDVEEGETRYYVRVQYNGDFFNVMNGKELKANQGSGNFTTLKGHKKDASGVNDYKPTYKSAWLTGGVAAGYTMEGIRVEGEVFYSDLNVDGSGYKDANKTTDKAERAGIFGVDDLVSKNANIASNNYMGKNEGLTSIVGMVNAYYDVDLGNENIPVVPYVGAGVGLSKVDFVGKKHYKLAYQAKAGVSYAVTPEIKLYGGYRYFGMYNNEFVKVNLTKTADGDNPKTETKEHNLKQEGLHKTLGIHGVEAGVMFHF